MTDRHDEEQERGTAGVYRRLRWDAVAAIIAALIGLLALLVSGYTAYIQRQEVRAQVWPHLIVGWSDIPSGKLVTGELVVLNRGVGPAVVRSVQVLVDGKPQPDWDHVIKALGLSAFFSETKKKDSAKAKAEGRPFYLTITSTLNNIVLSPGGQLNFLQFADHSVYLRFKDEMGLHAEIRVCYCSTLGECWLTEEGKRSLAEEGKQRFVSRPSTTCMHVPQADQFYD